MTRIETTPMRKMIRPALISLLTLFFGSIPAAEPKVVAYVPNWVDLKTLAPTIKAKAKFVVDEGLAGVMIWSLDYDVPGKRSLLTAIDETLHDRLPRQ